MRLVVKTGSATLSNPNGGLDRAAVERIAKQLTKAHQAGHDVILVTSGAIAAGVGRLGWKERPQDLRLKQAAAAVGQLALMEAYEQAFSMDGIIPAQILLTREDLTNRQRYLNVRNTLLHLLSLRTIPIINENDSVSTEEIQFGDNDSLSAIVATKVEADKLILLSDVPGLYEQDGNGRLTKNIIYDVFQVTAAMEKQVSQAKGSKMSAGGMKAKLVAAKMAMAAGIETWIASGREADSVERIVAGDPGAGTRFHSKKKKFQSRQLWIAFGRAPKGYLLVDEGAAQALTTHHKSLLPSGVKKVEGSFSIGDTVGIKADGVEIARGLVNFSSDDMRVIRGHHTRDVSRLLGRSSSAEVVHRDNMIFF